MFRFLNYQLQFLCFVSYSTTTYSFNLFLFYQLKQCFHYQIQQYYCCLIMLLLLLLQSKYPFDYNSMIFSSLSERCRSTILLSYLASAWKTERAEREHMRALLVHFYVRTGTHRKTIPVELFMCKGSYEKRMRDSTGIICTSGRYCM